MWSPQACNVRRILLFSCVGILIGAVAVTIVVQHQAEENTALDSVDELKSNVLENNFRDNLTENAEDIEQNAAPDETDDAEQSSIGDIEDSYIDLSYIAGMRICTGGEDYNWQISGAIITIASAEDGTYED
jgi:hypothetical protein